MQHHPEVLGIQGKVKTVKRKLSPGAGYGEPLNIGWQTYTYSGMKEGFAESDLEEYDPVAARLAFTRSLAVLRKAFRWEPDLETPRDAVVDLTASGQGVKAVDQYIRPFAHIIHGPTVSGGVGSADLKRFYTSFFHPLPPSFRIRLLSRTLDSSGGQMVDELFTTFTHSQEVPWVLPGIPATNKKVEVVIVSIVRMVGGRLESERVYWDQASVLVQVGLLDARMVPQAMKKKGVEELPIWGAESARAMKRGSSTHMNELIEGWDE